MSENQFIAAARSGENAFWRYALTVGLVIFLVLAGGVCMTLPAVFISRGSPDLAAYLPGPVFLALNLAPFIFIPVGLLIGLRVLHRRPMMTIINPTRRFDWGRFVLGAGLWLVLNILYNLVFAAFKPGYYTWSFDPLAFLPFLVVSLLLIPIQAGAEELAFRGYLTQGLGLVSWWLGWLIPSVLFGLLHGANPEVGAFGILLTLPVYIGMGLLFGWMTLRSGSLELALGVHIINNLYASLVTTFPSSALQTQAFFTIQDYDPQTELIAFFVVAALFVAILEWILRRKSISGWRPPAAPSPVLLALLAGGLLLGLAACTPRTPTPDANQRLPLSDCQLTFGNFGGGVDAQCGTLSVPENRADPQGRQIKLNVAVLKAVSRNPAPDPLFLLAGGPGEAATESFVALLSGLERARFKRDLVLVDQRGTGKSAALDCLPPAQTPTPVPGTTPTAIGRDAPRSDQLAEIQTCLDDLPEADLTQYTTEIAMQDLDEVRAALGYEQVNLLGVSYGTRAALTYARLFPDRVRSLILDGVVPPGWVLGSSIRADAQRALDLIFERCMALSDCSAAFPDFENDFYDLLARVQQQPVEVETTQPATGEKVRVAITPLTLTATVRAMSYNDSLTALLPLMIHSAYQGDYTLLASQYQLVMSSLGDSMSTGMYYSVWCYEDLPKLPAEGELGSYYFDYDMGLARDVCTLWPAAGEESPRITQTPEAGSTAQPGEPSAAQASTPAAGNSSTPGAPAAGETPEIDVERSFPRTYIPVLLISGEADPVTPPTNGDQVAAIFTNSLHIVLPGMGHANFYAGCLPTLLRDFIESASPTGLDPACTQSIHPAPFFLSPVGPLP